MMGVPTELKVDMMPLGLFKMIGLVIEEDVEL